MTEKTWQQAGKVQQKEKETGWPHCIWEAGSEEELGPGYKASP